MPDGAAPVEPYDSGRLDVDAHRAVLFDQRGCGRSPPLASDPEADLAPGRVPLTAPRGHARRPPSMATSSGARLREERASGASCGSGEEAREVHVALLPVLVHGTVAGVSFSVTAGSAPTIQYAGRPMKVLAGLNGRPTGFAVADLTVPAHFPGPPPHIHEGFDEGLYVLDGELSVLGDGPPTTIVAGYLYVAPRGERHGFANPSDRPVHVLGLWAPAQRAMDFMAAIGAVLPAQGPPDLATVRAVYEAHDSRLAP